MQKSTCTNILNSEVLHIVNSIHKKISLSNDRKYSQADEDIIQFFYFHNTCM